MHRMMKLVGIQAVRLDGRDSTREPAGTENFSIFEANNQ